MVLFCTKSGHENNKEEDQQRVSAFPVCHNHNLHVTGQFMCEIKICAKNATCFSKLCLQSKKGSKGPKKHCGFISKHKRNSEQRKLQAFFMMTVIFLLEQKMHHLQSEQLFPVFPQLLFLQKERSTNYQELIFF